MILLLVLACATEPGPPVGGASSVDSGLGGALETGEAQEAPDFRSATYCAECHPVHYEEWRQSMHAHAAQSPVFDAMSAKAYRDSGGGVGTFCTGCHAPFGAAEGEGGNTTAADRSDLSLEGVSCDLCHSAVDHDGIVGNGAIVVDTEGPVQGPYADTESVEHSSEQGALLTSPSLCGSCHDVFMYPGLQIEQAYTEHLESPAYEEGVRCQDCHMSTTPGQPTGKELGPIAVVEGLELPDRERSSHRFVGPDVALVDSFPFADDPEAAAVARAEYQERVQALLEGSVRLGTVELKAGPAGSSELSLVVESLVSGHRVPTGFTSERQLWLAVSAYGQDDVLLWQSGDLDADNNLRDGHSARVLAGEVHEDTALVNFQSTNLVRAKQFGENGIGEDGDNVDLLQSWSTIFPFDADTIIRNSLEPLEQRALSIHIPITGVRRVTVALRYRAMPPYVLQALSVPELAERVPVFTLDTAEAGGS